MVHSVPRFWMCNISGHRQNVVLDGENIDIIFLIQRWYTKEHSVFLTRVYSTHLRDNCSNMGIRLRTSHSAIHGKKEQMENYSLNFFCIFKFEQIIKDESKCKWANQKSLYNFNLGVIVKLSADQAIQMLTHKCVDIFFFSRIYYRCQGC